MEDIVDKLFTLDFDELKNLTLPAGLKIGLCIRKKSVKYEFFLNLKENCDKLIVLGSGAYVRSVEYDRTKPFFNRWSWEYDESIICYNDPTLYLSEELTGGWGIGVEDEYYLENIRDIILIISEKIKVQNKNILFFGSSMGGFMSIQLATMVKGSTALSDIPQLDLSHYDKLHWDLIRKHSFDNKSENYILENYYHRLSVCEMMKREKYIPNAVLNLDFSVEKDVYNQYLTFFKQFNELPFDEMQKNYIRIGVDSKSGKHEALSKKETLDLIEGVAKKNYMIYLNQMKESELYAENRRLKRQNRKLKKQNNAIISSNSWKLTGIFRKIGKIFKR